MNERLAFGAIERPQEVSDIELGSVTPQTSIPAIYLPTYQNFIDMQSQIGCCGAGAGKALKEVFTNIEGNPTHLSMEYLWKKIKDVDGIPLGDGTTLLGIMKGLQKYGVCTNDLLPTNAIGADPTIFAQDNTTPEQNTDASSRKITTGYAFAWSPTFQDIKTAIYNHKAVVLLMRVGQEFWINREGTPSWRTDLFPLNPNYPVESGHFVLAYGYDENYIYFLNQWSDAWGQYGTGWFGADYASRVMEMGTAVDLASAPLQAVLSYGSRGSAVSILQKRLSITVDGIFGHQTKMAVENFQMKHGLSADGIVGPKTYALLNSGQSGTLPSMTSITTHNIKMYALAIIPIFISVLGLISASYKLPFDVMGVVGVLTLIEHALNGNTSEPIIPASS